MSAEGPSGRRILVVEDEALVAADLEDRLRGLGFEVCAVLDTAEAALAQVRSLAPDLVLLDIQLKGALDGVAVAEVCRDDLDIPVVYLTAHADPATLRRAGASEPFGYVLKPFDERELNAAIEMALYRHRAELRLRRMERWLATTLQSIGDAVIATDAARRVTFINAAAEALSGWSCAEALGRDLAEVYSVHIEGVEVDLVSVVAQVVKGGLIFHLDGELELRRRDGEMLPIDDSVAPIQNDEGRIDGVVVLFRDRRARKQAETEQRELERRMIEVQRLESLGLLAGGVARDFNDVLHLVLANAEFCAREAPANSPLQRRIEQIELAGRRGAELCRQLLAYAGLERRDRRPIELSQVVGETRDLLAMTGAEINLVRFDLAPGLPPTLADPNEVRQLVLSLVANAVEAMAGRSGEVVVATRLVDAGRALAGEVRRGDLTAGPALMIEVADSGRGLPADTVRHIFDPFFSTKHQGRGLGLAAVHGIVRALGGAVGVASVAGQGATFRIYLQPAAPVPPAALPGLRAGETAEEDWLASGRVLLADDEEAMRLVGGLALEQLGFAVTVARDGAEAVQLVREDPTAWRLVVLDLTMPRLGGVQARREIREIAPTMPVLLASGYHVDVAPTTPAGTGADGFLQKPFDLVQLRRAVRAVLGSPA